MECMYSRDKVWNLDYSKKQVLNVSVQVQEYGI